jgi:hypothetical protein
MSTSGFRGGCLCQSLRYAAHVEPIDVGYCHCRTCQLSSGAPVLAWGSFSADSFAYTQGSPTIYRSSARGMREFCARCGTQIAFRKEGSDLVDINVASLDQPEAVTPEYHIWTESRISWFDTRDSLPRYRDAGPDDAGHS